MCECGLRLKMYNKHFNWSCHTRHWQCLKAFKWWPVLEVLVIPQSMPHLIFIKQVT